MDLYGSHAETQIVSMACVKMCKVGMADSK